MPDETAAVEAASSSPSGSPLRTLAFVSSVIGGGVVGADYAVGTDIGLIPGFIAGLVISLILL